MDKVFFYNPNKNLSKWLDKTLISRSNPEEEVNTEKSQEEQESNEMNSRSGKEKSWSQEELNKVEYTGSKEKQSKIEESQQDTQQPSDSLPNVIFQALDYIICSISSFFSWLLGFLKRKNNLLNNLTIAFLYLSLMRAG
ncbi:MAG: hypothetical protein ACR5K6_02250 [Wolbachia sp.]